MISVGNISMEDEKHILVYTLSSSARILKNALAYEESVRPWQAHSNYN